MRGYGIRCERGEGSGTKQERLKDCGLEGGRQDENLGGKKEG